jgi:hypothetical protein
VEGRYTGWGIHVDQDVFWPPGFDQDYTMGVQFEWRGSWVRDSILDEPLAFFDLLSFAGRAHRRGTEESHAFRFGNVAFTPRKDNLERTDPVPNDRPYANLLYVEVKRTTARNRVAFTSDLTLGVLGLGIGKGIQSLIHQHVSDDVTPGGWHHQISNGGEPTLKYHVGTHVLVSARCWDRSPLPCRDEDRWFELVADADANAGYYTNGSAGGTVRLGLIHSPFWTLERQPIAMTEAVRADVTPRKRLSELYVFASGGGTAWAYNALLQGQFRDSDVRLSFDEGHRRRRAPLRRASWEFRAGVTARFRRLSLTYSVAGHTPLFDGRFRRKHVWGALAVAVTR